MPFLYRHKIKAQHVCTSACSTPPSSASACLLYICLHQSSAAAPVPQLRPDWSQSEASHVTCIACMNATELEDKRRSILGALLRNPHFSCMMYTQSAEIFAASAQGALPCPLGQCICSKQQGARNWGTHTEGHSVQMGQHVRASSTNVSASSRETAAVLKPTAKGSAIANSTNSQLLSCAQTQRADAGQTSVRVSPCAASCAGLVRRAAGLQQYTRGERSCSELQHLLQAGIRAGTNVW